MGKLNLSFLRACTGIHVSTSEEVLSSLDWPVAHQEMFLRVFCMLTGEDLGFGGFQWRVRMLLYSPVGESRQITSLFWSTTLWCGLVSSLQNSSILAAACYVCHMVNESAFLRIYQMRHSVCWTNKIIQWSHPLQFLHQTKLTQFLTTLILVNYRTILQKIDIQSFSLLPP